MSSRPAKSPTSVTFKAKIARVENLPLTKNGNPVREIDLELLEPVPEIDRYNYWIGRTKPNASFVYGLPSNWTLVGQTVSVTVSLGLRRYILNIEGFTFR